jgi:hypothetical protein
MYRVLPWDVSTGILSTPQMFLKMCGVRAHRNDHGFPVNTCTFCAT